MKNQTLKSRTLRIVILIALFATFILPESTYAFGKPPKWAPAHGYRAKTRHIYFPEQNFYYDIQANNYLYLNNGNWAVSIAVPRPFININLSRSVQVQLDFVGSAPYRYNRDHCTKYKKVKVYKQPKHHVVYVKENHGKSHGKGHGHGNKHGKGKEKKHHDD
jgi:hypothetical protein